MPALTGAAIRVSYKTPLLVKHDEIVETGGQEMHAASFLRYRHIVLEGDLRGKPNEWRRVFVHELFHFAWMRLGNSRRASWAELLRSEFEARARGELGWSAEWRKKSVAKHDIESRTAHWREYACEAFCDTAAWMFAGLGQHGEFTLSRKWREPRRRWFIQQFGDRAVPL